MECYCLILFYYIQVHILAFYLGFVIRTLFFNEFRSFRKQLAIDLLKGLKLNLAKRLKCLKHAPIRQRCYVNFCCDVNSNSSLRKQIVDVFYK